MISDVNLHPYIKDLNKMQLERNKNMKIQDEQNKAASKIQGLYRGKGPGGAGYVTVKFRPPTPPVGRTPGVPRAYPRET